MVTTQSSVQEPLRARGTLLHHPSPPMTVKCWCPSTNEWTPSSPWSRTSNKLHSLPLWRYRLLSWGSQRFQHHPLFPRLAAISNPRARCRIVLGLLPIPGRLAPGPRLDPEETLGGTNALGLLPSLTMFLGVPRRVPPGARPATVMIITWRSTSESFDASLEELTLFRGVGVQLPTHPDLPYLGTS